MNRCFSLAALAAALTLTPAVLAQPDPIIIEEAGDASHLFAEAQLVEYPLSANPLVSGSVDHVLDCDSYSFEASVSDVSYIGSVWSQNEEGIAVAPKPTNLFTRLSGGQLNWESAFTGTSQPLVRMLVSPSEDVAVIDCNYQARYLTDFTGAEVHDPNPTETPFDYTLNVPPVRYVPNVHVLPQEEVFRTLDASYVLDCTGDDAVDAVFVRYDNPTAVFDPGEVKMTAIRIPRWCFHIGLKAYGNKVVDIVAMLPDGGLLPLGDCSQKYDEDDPTIPDINASLSFEDNGAAMPIVDGENVCLRHVPTGVDEVVLFFGGLLFFDGQTPRDPGDCDQCVRNEESVGAVRFSDMILMIINPEVSISGATVTGSGGGEVTASWNASVVAQIMGYSLTHVGGSMADTLVTVTDETADTEFRHSTSRSYELTLGGVPSGEQEFDLCALGRGTYSDLDVVPGSCLTRSATVPVANEDEPPGSEPPGSSTFALSVYPNPLMARSDLATARLLVPTAEVVRIAVYDVLGREVAVVHDGSLTAGEHELRLALTGLPSGTYLVRATSADGVATVRITVVR